MDDGQLAVASYVIDIGHFVSFSYRRKSESEPDDVLNWIYTTAAL